MGNERKFSALAGIRQHTSVEAPEMPPPPAPATVSVPAAGKGSRGRPAGKRSDPEFQPTTVLLRKSTKKAASRMLEDTNAHKDLSDLIEQLLAGWIKRQA